MTHSIQGRHFRTQQPIRLFIEGGQIARLESLQENAQPDVSGPSPILAPGFWDIQNNGGRGISYSDESLTVDQVIETVLAERAKGVARICPTLITASNAALLHGVATISAACRNEPLVDRMVVGIHLEGPHISPLDGYRGAHPAEHVCPPDLAAFNALWKASDGRIKIVTLAPEWPNAIDFISALVQSYGICVALGHTAADSDTIQAACNAGARLSTHLGNGIAANLPRHPNPIWDQAADDRLMASLIADGLHLNASVLKVLARVKGPERIILVSDASPLSGLPPGCYGAWEVEASGRIVLAGTPYLAGANQPLAVGLAHLARATEWNPHMLINTVTRNPAALLGMPWPDLASGHPADLVLLDPQPGTESWVCRAIWHAGVPIKMPSSPWA
jgi:N-acetylglucosamine-6-phosphate deacetylase